MTYIVFTSVQPPTAHSDHHGGDDDVCGLGRLKPKLHKFRLAVYLLVIYGAGQSSADMERRCSSG